VATTFLPSAAGWALGGGAAAFCLYQLRRAGHRLRWSLLAGVALGATAIFESYRGMPLPVLLMLLLAAAIWVMAAHTPVGRHLYAIGGNRDAAFYAGIPIQKRLMTAFALMGLVAGIAGIVLTARVGAASSDAGRMLELDAIAAAVIGGTSLMGGRGSVWGALVGAAVMASLDNGMSLMNTEAFWQPIIKGGILVAAVTADILLRRRRN
jgi:D-xylose transport system permease protein